MCCWRAMGPKNSPASTGWRWRIPRTSHPDRLAALKRNLKNHHGTVGAVALDRDGNLAAATSTGG